MLGMRGIDETSYDNIHTPPYVMHRGLMTPRSQQVAHKFNIMTPEPPLAMHTAPPKTPMSGEQGRLGFYKVLGESTSWDDSANERPITVRRRFIDHCEESMLLPLPVMIQRVADTQGGIIEAGGYGLGKKMMGPICRLLREQQWVRIDLSSNGLDSNCVKGLFDALYEARQLGATRLQHLNLSGNTLGPCAESAATVRSAGLSHRLIVIAGDTDFSARQ